jgi:light-harvesting complex II chlorophyll a/b binding protein 5
MAMMSSALRVNAFFKKDPPPPPPAKKGFSLPSFGKKAAPPPPEKKGFSLPNPFGKKDAPAKQAAPPRKAAPKKKSAPTKRVDPGSKANIAGQDLSKWYGRERKLYLPGGLLNLEDDVPDYLDGTLAGDYGFDPLKLGDDDRIEKYRAAEVIHARWAMLAVPGIIIPESLGIAGGVWTETGKVFLDGSAGRPEVLQNPIVFAVIQVVLFVAVEGYRSGKLSPPPGFAPFYGKWDEDAFDGLDPINPGGPLDFFGVAATPEDLAILKVKVGRALQLHTFKTHIALVLQAPMVSALESILS